MNNLSLTACSIWLREKRPSKNKGVKIIGLNQKIVTEKKEYSDFFDLLGDFCINYNNFIPDLDEKKMFKINSNDISIEENDSFRYTYIDIRSGGYGIEADILNTKTNEIAYKRKREDAEIIHYRVFFAVPKGNDVCKGIILFQNIGQYGIKTITTQYLSKYISETLNLYTTTGNICPQVFLKKLIEYDGISKIIYTRNIVSDDKSDIESIGYGKEQRIIANFRNRDKWKEKIFSYFNGSNGIYEFDNIDYTGLKMVTSIYGRERTINIHNIDRLSIIEGIPEEVKDKKGSIDDEKLKEHFIKVTGEYLENMVYNDI